MELKRKARDEIAIYNSEKIVYHGVKLMMNGNRGVTGVPAGLQNRVATLYAVGGFDSHMFPPKTTPLFLRIRGFYNIKYKARQNINKGDSDEKHNYWNCRTYRSWENNTDQSVNRT